MDNINMNAAGGGVIDDKKIVELFFDRSEDAVSCTTEKYGRYLTSIAKNILNDERDAEECVADSYIKLWNAIPPAVPACLRSFAAKITRNLALDRYEKNHAEKRGGGQLPLVLDELSECIASPQAEDGGYLTAALNTFLGDLKPEVRIMFMRRYWYMDSVAEIASMFGCGESRVKTTLFRARKQLRSVLKACGISM